ncbi:MAG TPA: hypothetical protein VIU37_08380, partial [Candidatus Limnocylindrales bacterium]
MNAEHAELRVTAGRLAGTEQETENEAEQKSERQAHDEPGRLFCCFCASEQENASVRDAKEVATTG